MLKYKLILLQFILILNNFVVKTKAFAYEAPSTCNNPNGRKGLCVSIYECQSLLNVLKTRQTCVYEFVRKSACAPAGQGRRPYVCCTSDTGFASPRNKSRIIFPDDDDNNDQEQNNISTTAGTTTDSMTMKKITMEIKPSDNTTTKKKNENYDTSDLTLLPKPPKCGPVSISFKIYGGEEADLGEFPWLANLEYKKPNVDGLHSVCAGNIINPKYILTAAHCIKGDIEIKSGQFKPLFVERIDDGNLVKVHSNLLPKRQDFYSQCLTATGYKSVSVKELIIPVSVRVGDHNTETPIDCNDAGCLDRFQRVEVENAIVHSAFGASTDYRNHNDIGLVRTKQDMLYSFSVAPICLPDTLPGAPKLRNGMEMTVAGWGHTGMAKHSAAKQKVKVPYVDNESCPIKVAAEQLCAGGEFKKDSCSGDSGGGLVRLVGSSWIIEGIVSYGRGCGLEKPGVYTRVSSYIPWIRANVQP